MRMDHVYEIDPAKMRVFPQQEMPVWDTQRIVKNRWEQLGAWVIGINVAALILCLIPFGVIVALPLGTLASALVQVELNKVADRHAG